MADSIIRNEYEEVVFFTQGQTQSTAFTGETSIQIANRYVRQHMAEMGLTQSRMQDDEASFADPNRANDPAIIFSHEKDIAGSTVVVFEQTVMDLPIFEAEMGVHIDRSAMGVISAQSSLHSQVTISNADQIDSLRVAQELTNSALQNLLGLDLRNLQGGRIQRQVVYRFEPEQRTVTIEDESEGCFGSHSSHILDLPSLSEGFVKGNHYIVNELLFRASQHDDEPPVNWRALLEPKSGAILYIRALVACATGLVFARDPQTQSGANVTGASSNAVLNPFRSLVTLPGTIASTPQPLSGEYVELAETSAPIIPAPTVANPSESFNYDVRTDNFAAVNAYYHCDKLFRTMADYGIDVFSYFDGTSFPVPVDHRALGNSVNAQAPGNIFGNGLGELRFALLQAGQSVGMATSNRVVWHEFGHALLWDHVNSPNFGFAHSAGDSFAAILNDPGTNEADRFDTFPWVQEATPLGRRHDRAVSDGWGWFGPQYNTQYRGEQILATTMFRLYQSIGGDAGSVRTQTKAAETVAYLIFKAIGLLTSTTTFPEIFVNNLQEADLTTSQFKNITGGALHKVIRWAFEKQGLFQPAARPGQGNTVMSEGNPPEVDVYIDDGRNGEYEYLSNHWSCQDMWVRRNADSGLTHQPPVVGQTNYMYVRVKNRGLQQAINVRVDAYHCLPGTGLSFPDDWMPMETLSLPASGPIARGGETIVGPFKFVPTQVGHECLLAIAHADGDVGNDITIKGTIPEDRFVPFDNNIGQRNVSPVLPTFRSLIELFREHRLWLRNPLKQSVVCRIEIQMPKVLSQLGWKLSVVSAGSNKFELGPRERREVMLAISEGQELDNESVRRAIAAGEATIEIRTYLNDNLSGGMSYPLSFEAGDDAEPARDGKKPIERLPERLSTIEEILRILRGQIPFERRSSFDRRIRTIRLEFDMYED